MKKLVLGLAIIGICLIARNAFALVGIDSYTTLMLHFNGVDGSTAITDSSFSNHTITANGDAQIDTAQSRFGGASAFFDGTGDYLAIPDSPDWAFGTGDFTIDSWFKLAAAQNSTIFAQHSEEPTRALLLAVYPGDPSIYFQAWDGGQAEGDRMIFSMTPAVSININQWYHIAGVRYGDDVSLYFDGTRISTATATAISIDFPGLVTIGTRRATSPYEYFNGWLDEFRISKGIARWTSDFTPPTSEYEVIPEPSTLYLLGLGLLGLVFKKKQIV